jgi:hypothetical protein
MNNPFALLAVPTEKRKDERKRQSKPKTVEATTPVQVALEGEMQHLVDPESEDDTEFKRQGRSKQKHQGGAKSAERPTPVHAPIYVRNTPIYKKREPTIPVVNNLSLGMRPSFFLLLFFISVLLWFWLRFVFFFFLLVLVLGFLFFSSQSSLFISFRFFLSFFFWFWF